MASRFSAIDALLDGLVLEEASELLCVSGLPQVLANVVSIPQVVLRIVFVFEMLDKVFLFSVPLSGIAGFASEHASLLWHSILLLALVEYGLHVAVVLRWPPNNLRVARTGVVVGSWSSNRLLFIFVFISWDRLSLNFSDNSIPSRGCRKRSGE